MIFFSNETFEGSLRKIIYQTFLSNILFAYRALSLHRFSIFVLSLTRVYDGRRAGSFSRIHKVPYCIRSRGDIKRRSHLHIRHAAGWNPKVRESLANSPNDRRDGLRIRSRSNRSWCMCRVNSDR